MSFKKVASVLHLWLGFIAGFILTINLLPAAVFTFNEELSEVFFHDQIYVKQVKDKALPVSELHAKAQAALPKDQIITGAEIERDPDKAYVFGSFKGNEKPEGITFFGEYHHYTRVYVDQYTGKVQGIIDMRYNWIYLCRVFHQQMLLRYDIGHLVIGIASLVLVVSVITGLVLWWPRNKAALKQRFSIKWDAKWRRKNYDVHNVGGFYSNLLLLLLAVSGLLWSFQWWAFGFYKILGDDYKTMGNNQEKVAPKPIAATAKPVDLVFADAMIKRQNWTEIYVGFPRAEAKTEERKVYAYISFNDHGAWAEGDQYEYNGDTGILEKQLLQENKSTAVKWQNSNYGIHTGSIYGLPSKIIICAVTLFCASLPVTGFVIWWGRKKKTKKKPAKQGAPKLAVA